MQRESLVIGCRNDEDVARGDHRYTFHLEKRGGKKTKKQKEGFLGRICLYARGRNISEKTPTFSSLLP